MKVVFKELKNALDLGWYEFRKALEWVNSKIPIGSGNNSDKRIQDLDYSLYIQNGKGPLTPLEEVLSQIQYSKLEGNIKSPRSYKDLYGYNLPKEKEKEKNNNTDKVLS